MAVSVDQLEMDRIDQGVLVYCPLLDQPASYVPDMVDLTQDTEARYDYFWNMYRVEMKSIRYIDNIGLNVSRNR